MHSNHKKPSRRFFVTVKQRDFGRLHTVLPSCVQVVAGVRGLRLHSLMVLRLFALSLYVVISAMAEAAASDAALE
jgi:hypothetical protein